ncbi:MAG: universal stress protein [Acidimicrobiales bacterium]|nr:universal stress protein [Acidimicrobiales bacterium]
MERKSSKQRIVVGIDGSEQSRDALEWAIGEAHLRGAKLEVVHAWIWPSLNSEHPSYPAITEPDQEAKAFLSKFTKEVLEKVPAPDLEIEEITLVGPAALVLDEQAEGADLLVVGARGHGGFAGLLLGSVSQQVTHHAPCPVVIIRKHTFEVGH